MLVVPRADNRWLRLRLRLPGATPTDQPTSSSPPKSQLNHQPPQVQRASRPLCSIIEIHLHHITQQPSHSTLVMPPRRRAAAQATLSFGNQSRVTKPASTPTTMHKAKTLDSPASVSPSGTPEPQQVLAEAHPSKPHVAELAVRQQAATERKEPRSAEDEQALKVSKKDLVSYWRKEEQKRMTLRGESNRTGLWDCREIRS